MPPPASLWRWPRLVAEVILNVVMFYVLFVNFYGIVHTPLWNKMVFPLQVLALVAESVGKIRLMLYIFGFKPSGIRRHSVVSALQPIQAGSLMAEVHSLATKPKLPVALMSLIVTCSLAYVAYDATQSKKRGVTAMAPCDPKGPQNMHHARDLYSLLLTPVNECWVATLMMSVRNSADGEYGRKGRRSLNRAVSYALESANIKCVNESFEIVNYRDSIKVFSLDRLHNWTGLKCFRDRHLWFVKDSCGVFCVVLTWSLIMFAECVVSFILLESWKESVAIAVNGFIFHFFTLLGVVSHLKSMFIDPGAVPRGNATRENIAKLGLGEGEVVFRCPKCICIKPDRAHHCRICRRCIRKMDHHCPWINNCVGEFNQKYFILFTLYICITSCQALVTTVVQLYDWWSHNWRNYRVGIPAAASIVLLVLLIIEAIAFGIFTGIMFWNQLWAVLTDETQVEHVKKESRERLSRWLAFKSVFGHQFSYRWFSPFHNGIRYTACEASSEILDTDGFVPTVKLSDCLMSDVFRSSLSNDDECETREG